MTINQLIRKRSRNKVALVRKSSLNGSPHKKCIVTQVMKRNPRKPNSANRSVVRARLATGESILIFLKGEKHTIQEHNPILISGGSPNDLPGVRYTAVRGKYSFTGVVNRKQSRSRYGTKKIK